jgi:adenylate kinase
LSGSSALNHVVIFGRPGSGKSSLAERLHADFSYVLVRTGEMLREAVRRGDPLGHQVEETLKTGSLVPDAVIEALLSRTLKSPDSEKLLFDGFPRTLGQVAMLERFEKTLNFQIDCHLEIAISRAAAEARMMGRRVCPVCGATYHVTNQPPLVPETCDRDHSRLERRRDDQPEVIALRQQIYDAQTAPILDHYRSHAPERYRAVNGELTFEALYAETCRALELEPKGGRSE